MQDPNQDAESVPSPAGQEAIAELPKERAKPPASLELCDAIAKLTPGQVRRVRAKLLKIKEDHAVMERRLNEIRRDLGISD